MVSSSASIRNSEEAAQMRIARRDLLRGLGLGTVILSPFVRSVEGWAQGKNTGNFLAFFSPNGFVRSSFGASGSGASFALKPSLAPLEPYKTKLSVCSPLDNSALSPKGSHEDMCKQLTAVPGADMYTGYGPSIDWVIAGASGQRPMTMSSLCTSKPNYQTKLSWKSAGVSDPHVDSALTIFNELFGSAVPNQSQQQTDRLLAARRSVLDYIKGDIASLNARLAAPDRQKLSNHLDGLRQLELALAPGAVASCNGSDAVKTRATDSPSASGAAGYVQSASICNGGNGGCATGAEAATMLQSEFELRVEVIATAFACGVRRAATLMVQPGNAGINPIGGVGNHHQVTHDGPMETRIQIDRWYATRFAYLLKRLSEMQILDTTVVVWVTEISEEHYQQGFVTPVAGGGALGMQHGQLYGNGKTLSNLWVSVQQAMGISSATFGSGSSGGIPGLFKPV
jgi:Protein of unknown function (DUF1552)